MPDKVAAVPAAVPRARGEETPVTTATTPAADPVPVPAKPRWWTNPGLIAVLVFAITGPLAFVIPHIPQYNDGAGSLRSIGMPLAAGFGAGAILLLLAMRKATGQLAGVVAAYFASWAVMGLATAMRGTPFPFFGLLGDSGRLTAMATRYSVTWGSADAMMPGLPSEYPPLFPWLVGRTSALLDIPAWRLMGDFEVAFTGLAIVFGFVMWQRLVNPWLALAVTIAGFMTFPLPVKAYELITLMVVVPWILGTFMNPPRGRLHWLASGVVGGFILLTYYGWLIFAVFGILAIAFGTWRRAEDRRGFLLYLAKAAGVALLVASWFVIPLLHAKFTIGGSTVADLYGSSNMLDLIFPFLQITYPGVSGIIAMTQLIGLVGLIWLRGRTWWATPMLLLVAGAYLYRVIGAVLFVLTEHTVLSQYTPSVYGAVMAMAGALTVAHVTPKLIARLSLPSPKHGVAIAMAVMVAYCGYTFTIDWTPGAGGRYSDYTERAYREPFPDGTYAKGFEPLTPWFPVTPIQREVEKVLGPDHDAVALAVDERLYAFLPWKGYLGNDLWSSIARVFDRVDEVKRVAAITDPAEFTRSTSDMRFGRVDIFVLRKEGAAWQWNFHQGFGQPEVLVDFHREQFDPDAWVIVDDLPENIVLAIRKP